MHRRLITPIETAIARETARGARLNHGPTPRRFTEERTYQVVFQLKGRRIETLYWRGSLEETEELATEIALESGAMRFRIIECASEEMLN